MTNSLGFFVVGIIYIAILYVLVKPGSTGAATIKTITDTLSDLIKGVTGETFNSSSNTWSTGNA